MTKLAWIWLRSVSSTSVTPCRSTWVVVCAGGGPGQERAEAVQAAFGGQLLPADPVRGRCQGSRNKLVGADPPLFVRGDQAGFFQHAEVLGDRGERHRKRLGERAY